MDRSDEYLEISGRTIRIEFKTGDDIRAVIMGIIKQNKRVKPIWPMLEKQEKSHAAMQ